MEIFLIQILTRSETNGMMTTKKTPTLSLVDCLLVDLLIIQFRITSLLSVSSECLMRTAAEP